MAERTERTNRLCSQHPHGGSQLSLTPIPGDLASSSEPSDTRHISGIDIHTSKMPIHYVGKKGVLIALIFSFYKDLLILILSV